MAISVSPPEYMLHSCVFILANFKIFDWTLGRVLITDVIRGEMFELRVNDFFAVVFSIYLQSVHQRNYL